MLFNILIMNKGRYVLCIFILSSTYQSVWCQNRIVGGSSTTIKNVPYMLHFTVVKTHSCGAAIISQNWGLTAAHCFDNSANKKINVVGGTTNIRKLDKTASVHQVTKYYVHEKFKRNAESIYGYDIAVFMVSPPFKYSAVMQPVKLPQKGVRLDESWGQVAGWGHTKSNGTGSNTILYVKLPHVSKESCKNTFAKIRATIHSGEICYGYWSNNVVKDSCQGDSGGPLVNSKSIAIGVVSWGIGYCGQYPGVYTETLYFRDWIKKKTGI